MKDNFLCNDLEIFKGKPFIFNKSVEALENYLSNASTVRRGAYSLSEKTTESYEQVRNDIANLISCSSREIIFISLNDKNKMLDSIKKTYNVEELKNFKGLEELKLSIMSRHLNDKLVAIEANDFINKTEINVKVLDIDIMFFSSKYIYGLDDVMIFYAKRQILETISPFEYGGDMVNKVSFDNTSFSEPPYKFEAGTPDIGSILSLGPAVKFLIANISKLEELFLEFYLLLMTSHKIYVNEFYKYIQFLEGELAEKKITISVYNDKKDIKKLFNDIKKGRI